jgi:hypothetical protein
MYSTGAAIGAIVGTCAAGLKHKWTRQDLIQLGLLVTAATCLIALIPLGAHERQHHLEDAVATQFKGLTLADYQAWTGSDELGTKAFTVDHVFSTGATETDESAVVRYPSSFMGITQCVIATWRPTGVRVARRSGESCSRFMG